jgi:hypothetical protein
LIFSRRKSYESTFLQIGLLALLVLKWKFRSKCWSMPGANPTTSGANYNASVVKSTTQLIVV